MRPFDITRLNVIHTLQLIMRQDQADIITWFKDDAALELPVQHYQNTPQDIVSIVARCSDETVAIIAAGLEEYTQSWEG